jgi:hypothetical protein
MIIAGTVKGVSVEIPYKRGRKRYKCLWLEKNGKEKFIPYGGQAFYYVINQRLGIKVYYSWKSGKSKKKKYVEGAFKKLKRLFKLDLGLKPKEIMEVDVSLKKLKSGEYQKHKAHSYGILMRNALFPIDPILDYAKGYDYVWTNIGKHTEKEYNRFRRKCARVLKARKPSFRNVVFCKKKQRFYLCDEGGK